MLARNDIRTEGCLTQEEWAQIESRALEIIAAIEAKTGPYNAEIIPECAPKWHLVTTFASAEEKAADWLSDRGFGVFVPRFMKNSRLRLQAPTPIGKAQRFEEIDLGEKLVFPGRILLFVWDILAHWQRVMACPGVQAIMVDDRERPITVSDEQVDRIQFLQFSLIPGEKAKRRRKRYRSAPDVDGDNLLTISTKSYWAVDGAGRNQALDKALGLAL